MHVEDVARAITMTLRAPIDLVAGEVFNVGDDPQNYTLGRCRRLINKQVPDARIISDETFVDKRNYRVCLKRSDPGSDLNPPGPSNAALRRSSRSCVPTRSATNRCRTTATFSI